ncbi:disease resistance RPP13-like protein 4 [Cinnamomum micranthum f. kanehirae]|uniref:Disease resistance RPP13-like protein 4 n=1 Tax=Cinnamomum micranthum f. kanehirae TaxID=337451 RepID=A0A3S3QNV8_9MAGN|nr:disease resistance RPP13-like protein 4 [Cinnamomum micranthum f. kanehirae]
MDSPVKISSADIELETLLRKRDFIGHSVEDAFLDCQKAIKNELEELNNNIENAREDLYSKTKPIADVLKEVRLNLREMEMIKKFVEEELHSIANFPSKDANGVREDASNTNEDILAKWPEIDRKMEFVLETAATGEKEKDFDKLNDLLKKCLMCLSIFPADKEIEKRVLIYWWIGEGFVQSEGAGAKTAEEVGEDLFNILIEKEFIHPVYKRFVTSEMESLRSKDIVKCKVHPWISWMLISKAKQDTDTDRMFFFDERGSPSSSQLESSCHCLVLKRDHSREQEEKQKKKQPSRLQSLFNLNEKYLRIQPLSKMKVTNVLQLGTWQGQLQDDIQVENSSFLSNLSLQAATLKYLSLRSVLGIRELPDSIALLTNLMILDLKDCKNLEKLNEKIKGLSKLTNLNISGCTLVRYMPKELGFLKEMEVLKGFVVCAKDSGQCTVAELATMSNLRKLSITVRRTATIGEDEWEGVSKMCRLRSLGITWGDQASLPPNNPLDLEKLELRRFPCEPEGTTWPKWMVYISTKLKKLRKLHIRGGKMDSLSPEQAMDIIELHLKHLQHLNLKWSEVSSKFPKLAYLEICGCPRIKGIPQSELNLTVDQCQTQSESEVEGVKSTHTVSPPPYPTYQAPLSLLPSWVF